MEKLFDKGRNQLRQQIDIVKFFTELNELKQIVRLKVPLTKEEYDEVKETAKLTLLDDYTRQTQKGVRKIAHHEQVANEIFSKRSDAGNNKKANLDGTVDSRRNSVLEGNDSDINFGPNNPTLLRSKTIGLKR